MFDPCAHQHVDFNVIIRDGKLYADKGQYKTADNCYRRAIEIENNNSEQAF